MPAKSTLYARVAADVAGDIEQGLYPPGHKLPSVRVLSRRLSVSISTVTQAYASLEDQGYIRSRPQSGYFVLALGSDQAPPPSKGEKPSVVTKASLINRLLTQSKKPGVTNLGTAVPDIAFLPYRALQTYIQKVTRFERDDVFSYFLPPGLEALRQVIAQRMLATQVRCHADDVVITSGATEAINLCLRTCTQPGDIIAIESPCYYGYLQFAKQQGLKVVEIPTDPVGGISLEALQLSLNEWPIKAILLSARYSNPTGAQINRDKQRRLLNLARQYAVPIIEDDVYGELGHGDELTTTLKSFDDDGLVMYCSSFSKTINPGLRVGWCVPGRHLDKLIEVQTYTNWSTASLGQLAINAYLRHGHYDKHLRQLRAVSAENTRRAAQVIKKQFPEGTLISQPSGGFVLWMSLPEGVNAMHLHEQALAHNISLAPGGLFSNTDHFDNYLRINCAIPWEQKLKPSLQKVAALVCDLAKSL